MLMTVLKGELAVKQSKALIRTGIDSIFDVDTIHEILKIVERKTGVEYKGGEAETDIS